MQHEVKVGEETEKERQPLSGPLASGLLLPSALRSASVSPVNTSVVAAGLPSCGSAPALGVSFARMPAAGWASHRCTPSEWTRAGDPRNRVGLGRPEAQKAVEAPGRDERCRGARAGLACPDGAISTAIWSNADRQSESSSDCRPATCGQGGDGGRISQEIRAERHGAHLLPEGAEAGLQSLDLLALGGLCGAHGRRRRLQLGEELLGLGLQPRLTGRGAGFGPRRDRGPAEGDRDQSAPLGSGQDHRIAIFFHYFAILISKIS